MLLGQPYKCISLDAQNPVPLSHLLISIHMTDLWAEFLY